MKKTLTTLTAIAALTIACAVKAQTAPDTNAPAPSFKSLLTDLGLTSMPTNIIAGPFIEYGLQNHNWVPGIEAGWNLNGTVGLGIMAEYNGGGLSKPANYSLFAGTITLRHAFPLSFIGLTNVFATPYGTVALGTPLGGTGPANGNLAVKAITGANVSFPLGKGWTAGVNAYFGTKTGCGSALDGALLGIGPTIGWNF